MVNNSLGDTAKKNLEELVSKVDLRLKKYWKTEIKYSFGVEESQKALVKKILEHAKEHNLRPAKRIRASFVYYGYLLLGKEVDEDIWKVMEGIELVQTALLMQDDFMDEDKLRRGLPTTHEYFANGDKHYGDCMAVNVGDFVLCLGYERVMQCELDKGLVLRATKTLMRGIANTALGQAYDVTLPKMGELTVDKILAVQMSKTAIYTFQNPLLIGAILAGLGEGVLAILKKYAFNGGVAFQIQDDVLGMFGESKKTGKSDDSDLRQGKSTLLIARMLEIGTKQQKEALKKAWGNKRATKQEIAEAKKAIKESGSLDYSVKLARRLAKEAIEEAEKLNKFDLNLESIYYLKGIMEYVITRNL